MVEVHNLKNDDDLWDRYLTNKDILSRNEIINRYSYIVKIIAVRIRGIYQQYGEVDDIVNEGILALIDAINKFDITKNIKFETYATIRIKGAIIDYVRKQAWTPRRVNQNKKLIDNANRELSNILGRSPTGLELAKHLNMNIKEYNKIISETHNVNLLSFEDVVNQLSINNLYNLNESSPEDNYTKKELQLALANGIDALNEKERLVISLYYKEEVKLKNIASILKISNSRASQIHSQALRKLNEYITKNFL